MKAIFWRIFGWHYFEGSNHQIWIKGVPLHEAENKYYDLRSTLYEINGIDQFIMVLRLR